LAEISRISTGIEELDKTLSGGLIKGRVYLISGDVGIGKTTAALQFLLRGIQDGEKVAILTDTSRENMIEDMHSLGLDIEDQINNGTLLLIEFHEQFEDLKNKVIEKKENPKKVLTKILSEISNIVKQNNIKRLVIDPISPLVIPSTSMYTYVKTLITTLYDTSCTTIITSGIMSPNDQSVYDIAEHVSGVILFSYGESLKRSRFFSIKKMRGTYCNPNLHEFTIKFGKGICSPDEKPVETHIPDEKPVETHIPDEKPVETHISDMRPKRYSRSPYAL
jgi:circadian clock protein KaiC